MTAAAPRRAAVLGHPVAHSLSPALHRAAYAALGLDGLALRRRRRHGGRRSPAFVAGLDDTWAGLSLTMPLKQTVIPLLDHVEPLAEVVGAVNTVLFQGRTLVGANTDVHGHRRRARGSTGPIASAAVLGAGATASSTLAALAQLGCTSPVVYVRAVARAGGLMRAAHRMGVTPVYRTLDDARRRDRPRGRRRLDPPAARRRPAGGPARARPTGVLLDVAYDPRPTALSVAWAAAGGAVVGGEQMLLHQAAEQVRLMTGHPAPLAAMAAALEDKLTA